MNEPECDSTTGICSPGESAGATSNRAVAEDLETVVYSGDPMCSWCWGMAPTLHRFQRYCEDVGIPFRILVGGLRPGGGDPWNRQFREFLGHHWQEVASRTGQPFDHRLLERDSFEYDTEPACRAVVAARPLIEGTELPFFSAIQGKFYVDGEDPKEREFYRSICEQHGLEYDAFALRFDSDTVRHETREEFRLSRDWGVTGFPTVLVRVDGRSLPLVVGYGTFDDLERGLVRAIPRLA